MSSQQRPLEDGGDRSAAAVLVQSAEGAALMVFGLRQPNVEPGLEADEASPPGSGQAVVSLGFFSGTSRTTPG